MDSGCSLSNFCRDLTDLDADIMSLLWFTMVALYNTKSTKSTTTVQIQNASFKLSRANDAKVTNDLFVKAFRGKTIFNAII